MAHAASGIGLQNPAFFVGRAELLEWVNGLLSLRLTKVEQVRALPLHASLGTAAHVLVRLLEAIMRLTSPRAPLSLRWPPARYTARSSTRATLAS